MSRRDKPTDAEFAEFWAIVEGRQQERFNLRPDYFGQQSKTIPPENFTAQQDQENNPNGE